MSVVAGLFEQSAVSVVAGLFASAAVREQAAGQQCSSTGGTCTISRTIPAELEMCYRVTAGRWT